MAGTWATSVPLWDPCGVACGRYCVFRDVHHCKYLQSSWCTIEESHDRIHAHVHVFRSNLHQWCSSLKNEQVIKNLAQEDYASLTHSKAHMNCISDLFWADCERNLLLRPVHTKDNNNNDNDNDKGIVKWQRNNIARIIYKTFFPADEW